MRHILISVLASGMLTLAAACGSSTSSTLTAADPSTPATTGASAPSISTTTAPPPTTAAAVDPFEQYYALVHPLEPNLSKQQLREKLDQAVRMYCGGGRDAMLRLKTLASGPHNNADEQRKADERAATSIGALWEFGCRKGHDDELYKPAGTPTQWDIQTTTTAGSPAGTGRRDANGETREQYCARTHQPLDHCQAG